MNWSNWENIEIFPDYKGKGVYKIRLVNNKGEILSIQRFLGEDKGGLLMIGQTSNINRRLREFYNVVIKEKNSPHSEAKTLRLARRNPKFEEKFRKCSFQYSFNKVENNKEEEKKLLENYFNKYGETTPLNYKREFYPPKNKRD